MVRTLQSSVRCFFFLAALSGCARLASPQDEESEAQGHAKAAMLAIKGPAKKSALKLKALGRYIATKVSDASSMVSPSLARSKTKKIIIAQIIEENGIARSQQREVLQDLVDPQSMDCGGASCQRVLGFGPNDVGPLLDETYDDIQRSPTFAKPEHAAHKELLLASLDPGLEQSPSRSWRFNPAAVGFRLARAAGVQEFRIGTSGLNITINLKPRDLLRTENLRCHRDVCEATVEMPIKVNAEAELPLNTRLQLTYSRAPDSQGTYVEQKALIDGKMKTLRIGEVLDISIDFRAKVEKTVASGKKFVVKDVICVGNVSCELPMVSLSARVNREGIEFAGSTKPNVMNKGLLKMVGESKSYRKAVQFSELNKTVQSIKGILSSYGTTRDDSHLDVKWDDLVFAMTQ